MEASVNISRPYYYFIRNNALALSIFLSAIMASPGAIAQATIYYGAPYYHHGYSNNGPYDSVSTAIDAWWADWSRVWPSYTYCGYVLAYEDPQEEDGTVAHMFLNSPCTGGNEISATKYFSYLPEKNIDQNDCQSPRLSCGNPINVSIANKHQEETDFEISPLLGFSRYYNSHAAASSSALGVGWSHTYSAWIDYINTGSSNVAPTATISRPEGGKYAFRYVDGKWKADADIIATLRQVFDDNGGVQGWIYTPVDGRESEEYDVLGRLVRISRTDGNSIDLIYNNGVIQGNVRDRCLSLVQSQDGRALIFQCDSKGKITSVMDAAGNEYLYEYDSSERLQSVTYPDGAQRSYLINESAYLGGASMKNALTGIRDENGARFATFSYDSTGRAISTEHAGGMEKYSISYVSDDSAVIVGPNGKTDSRDFGSVLGVRKALTSVETCSDCLTRSWSYAYNDTGHISSATDPNGWTISYEYEGRGLLVRKREAQNGAGAARVIEEDWHADFTVPLERRVYDADATLVASSQWTYNAGGLPVGIARIDSATSTSRVATTTYCEQGDVNTGSCPRVGLIVKTDSSRNDVSDLTTYTYYEFDHANCAGTPAACSYRKGDLWKTINALGQITEVLAYDGNGRILSTKSPNGITTDYEYHPRGWLAAVKVRGADSASESDDRITRINYWPTGLVKQITQPDGAFTTFTYDAAHRLTDIADNAGNILHYTLDNAGNRVKEDAQDVSGALKHTLSRIYNQFGQIKTQATAVGDPTDFAYDANGNITSLTDALGRKTQNDYDPLNRLSRTLQDIDGIQAETRFVYDALDNITQVTDPKGLGTHYEYNGFGDLVKLASPDTGITAYTYDSAGNRASQTDARGITTTYGYDALNRLIKVGYPTSGLNVSYTYDVSQNVCASDETYAVGRLVKMQDGGAITQYCYNRFGDLVRKVQTTNGKSLVLRYTYTSGGRLQQMTYPDGAAVDYVRNAQGQPVEVGVTPSGGNRQVLLTEASYYPFGPSAGWTYGNGRTLQRIYDQDYRAQAIQDTRPGGLEIGFGFDPVGNLTALTPAGNATPDITLDYDPLGRLTAFKDSQTGALIDGYTYDATGNRLSAQVNGAVQGYTYPSDSHRLSAVSGTAYAYDAAGNTTAIGGTARQYVYDATGRMSQARRSGSVVMNYRYNGRGEQVRRFLGNTNTYTLYDEMGHWLGDYDDNGAPLQQAIWLDDLPVGLLAAGGPSYYIEPDHLGSPRVVIDPERDVAVWTWSLKGEAFGNTVPDQDPDGDGSAFVLDMRFPGQRYDAASGLHYNYFRDYEPGTGRYSQSDPIGLAGGENTYAYVGASPIMWTDPFGLEVLLCSQPAQIPGMGWVDHQWIKTDTVEAGMGGIRGNVPGNQSGDMPGDPVQVTNHAGRSNEPGASCKKVDNVDEAEVNAQLQIGRSLGRWGPTNQCQSFAARTIWNASTVDRQVEQNQRLLNSRVPGLR